MKATVTVNRAERLRLQARLAMAEHAAELLHDKEEALRREQSRLEGHANRTAAQWQDASRSAASSLLLARAMGASGELDALCRSSTPAASVSLSWRSAMGVTYPGDADCRPVPRSGLVSTAALVPARDAYRRALLAGAEHAVATTALQRIEDELARTRRRRRAVEVRLVPDLTDRIHRLDVELDERDREAASRAQLAAGRERRP